MQAETFALSMIDAEIENNNVFQDKAWSIILGNDADFSKVFYGSLKDVRLWKTARLDSDLYTYRFRQVPQ